MGRWAKYRKLPVGDRRLLWQAWRLLATVRVGLWLLPFARLRKALERRSATSGESPPTSPRVSSETIAWAVNVASDYVPGTDTCLPQALTAQCLLARHGHPAELCFGVARDEQDSFKAHAWVESDGKVVIGARELERFTPMEPS